MKWGACSISAPGSSSTLAETVLHRRKAGHTLRWCNCRDNASRCEGRSHEARAAGVRLTLDADPPCVMYSSASRFVKTAFAVVLVIGTLALRCLASPCPPLPIG